MECFLGVLLIVLILITISMFIVCPIITILPDEDDKNKTKEKEEKWKEQYDILSEEMEKLIFEHSSLQKCFKKLADENDKLYDLNIQYSDEKKELLNKLEEKEDLLNCYRAVLLSHGRCNCKQKYMSMITQDLLNMLGLDKDC